MTCDVVYIYNHALLIDIILDKVLFSELSLKNCNLKSFSQISVLLMGLVILGKDYSY